MADLGKVAVRARGEWVIGVAYETLDMVTHNLNLYIALKDTAIEPTDDGVNWQLLMEGVPIATASKAGKSNRYYTRESKTGRKDNYNRSRWNTSRSITGARRGYICRFAK